MKPGPRPLPEGYLGMAEVCADMGLEGGANSFGNKRRRAPDSVPPMEKFPGGRLGIRPEDYAAWKRERHLATVRDMTRQLAAQAAELRRETAEIEEQLRRDAARLGADARDALAS
jgi:hypothetical protein